MMSTCWLGRQESGKEGRQKRKGMGRQTEKKEAGCACVSFSLSLSFPLSYSSDPQSIPLLSSSPSPPLLPYHEGGGNSPSSL